MLGSFALTHDGPTDRVATVAYPNGQTTAYSYYPSAGDYRLQTIHHKYPNASTLSKFDYAYDADGNIVTWRQQADATASQWVYMYDGAAQLVSAVQTSTDPTPAVLKRFAYAYDLAGNRTAEQVDDVLTGATYDAMNRLVSRQPVGSLTFDGSLSEPATVTIQGQPAAVGTDNRFRGTAPVGSGGNVITIIATDASGNVGTRQYQVTNSGTMASVSYDANGNLTADGSRTFEWDARNQLVAVNVGTHRSEFTYDGEQHRVRIVEKENGITLSDTKIVWCNDEICEERAGDGITVTRRPLSLGEQVAGVSRFFTPDHLGSVREVTESSGVLLARYAFDPWGRRTLVTGTVATNVAFTGHIVHPVSSANLTLYRAYDQELARWISEDPLGLLAGVNRFSYALNNPLQYTDPLGLDVRPFPKPPPPAPPLPPGGPRGWVAPFKPKPYTPTMMTPKNILNKGGKLGAIGVLMPIVTWSWSCVILETYCATQALQGYNACMTAADPDGSCFKCK